MHQRRGTFSSEVGKYALDPRVISSTGSSPNMRRTMKGGIVSVSMDSLQMSEVGEQFTGSTGSLPSIGSTSNSEHSVSPDPDSKSPRHEASPRTPPLPPLSTSDNSTLSSSTHKQTMSQEEIIANDLVVKCLDAAVNRFKLEGRQVLWQHPSTIFSYSFFLGWFLGWSSNSLFILYSANLSVYLFIYGIIRKKLLLWSINFAHATIISIKYALDLPSILCLVLVTCNQNDFFRDFIVVNSYLFVDLYVWRS